jgi:DNA-binding GntR family transcriptional regulator
MTGDNSPPSSKVKPNLREIAYARVVQHLRTGTLRAGQFVTQRELVQLTGLPLAAIREAILRLQAERLLETVPQRGMQIARVDIRMVQDVFHLWLVLAKGAAEAFAQNAPDQLIDELHLLHKKALACAVMEPIFSEYAREAELQFHDALIGAMRNDRIADVYRLNLIRVSIIALSRALGPEVHAVSASLKERLKVISACKSRNPNRVVTAIEAHISATLQRMVVLSPGAFAQPVIRDDRDCIIAA